MGKAPHTPVRRRLVFYLPGYDPIHPRRYRELYRKEGAEQAEIGGYDLALHPRRGKPGYGWLVATQFEGRQTETEFEVLVWSDIVRAHMNPSIPATYAQLARTAWAYVGSGALWRLMRLRKGPTISALYPIVVLLAQLAVALCVARLVGAGLALTGVPFLGWLGLLAVWPVLWWFRRHDGKVFAWYLMHDYAFSAIENGAYPAELEARLAVFADRLTEALRQPDIDEVLLVGHSSGAYLGVSVLADMLRAGRLPQETQLSFLSLGHVVPMVSFLPKAWRLRADLALMGEGRIPWVDVTAPGDGCAFALCDPVAVSGVAPKPQNAPLIVSAAFSQTLSPERQKMMQWRFFRRHFQYLCAFDKPGPYDYFRITAGPESLAAHFAGRAHSPSRDARPLNRHTSTVP
ncbi:hypothetical protein C8N32_1277 [Rhodovulum imhoffii]|uniref:Alpha/beta hydrolase family protein n=1 Tax=Rhodovulum imhoffii TaxID=365340 RepID=A0A2T5BNR8_9RHOB|nr:hypothetical protein [Rhodovulum imhoffii]MBK5932944.1 hypothetical protein [Rhodovulum imhoffii]PTN00635.1 hypothetical protein C8N32_1277 [Rhodovulum imhoffii]